LSFTTSKLRSKNSCGTSTPDHQTSAEAQQAQQLQSAKFGGFPAPKLPINMGSGGAEPRDLGLLWAFGTTVRIRSGVKHSLSPKLEVSKKCWYP